MFYQELDRNSHGNDIIPDKEKREFWCRVWEKDIKHSESADWIQKVAEEI